MKLGLAGRMPTFQCVQVPDDSETEALIVKRIGERLLAGYNQYGPFDREDKRDFVEEALQEVLDGMIYVGRLLVEIKAARHEGVLSNAAGATGEAVQDTSSDGRKVRAARPGSAERQERGEGRQVGGEADGSGEAASAHGAE